MQAIDTNLIVRYLTGDHPEQSARARVLIDTAEVFVATTVLLESEWVLRSVYGFAPARLVTALRAFAGLPRVTLGAPASLAKALDWMATGVDFADALHLAGARGCDAFITFDQRFAAAVAPFSAIEVCAP
jgi:predicted nucleic acid-binding protein